MTNPGIPLDKAELLGALLEGVLYGFSLLMFGGTIQMLLSRRPLLPVNRKLLVVACLLLMISTTHFVIHITRVMYGFVLYRDTYPGGPLAYFSDVSQWTFNAKNHAYIVQTLVGDSVVIYRCYVVWQSYLVIVLPVLLWCATGVTGITASVVAQHSMQNSVFGGALQRWITGFWATALSTNLLATLLLIFRIWYIDRNLSRTSGGTVTSQVRPVLKIILESGALYSLTLIVALICFVSETNGQYVMLDMVTPIISITFYLVIIRVGLAARGAENSNPFLGITSLESMSAERKRRMQVHVVTSTESKFERGQDSPLLPDDPRGTSNETTYGGGRARGGEV